MFLVGVLTAHIESAQRDQRERSMPLQEPERDRSQYHPQRSEFEFLSPGVAVNSPVP
jgi:hypothetical protein